MTDQDQSYVLIGAASRQGQGGLNDPIEFKFTKKKAFHPNNYKDFHVDFVQLILKPEHTKKLIFVVRFEEEDSSEPPLFRITYSNYFYYNRASFQYELPTEGDVFANSSLSWKSCEYKSVKLLVIYETNPVWRTFKDPNKEVDFDLAADETIDIIKREDEGGDPLNKIREMVINNQNFPFYLTYYVARQSDLPLPEEPTGDNSACQLIEARARLAIETVSNDDIVPSEAFWGIFEFRNPNKMNKTEYNEVYGYPPYVLLHDPFEKNTPMRHINRGSSAEPLDVIHLSMVDNNNDRWPFLNLYNVNVQITLNILR